MCGFALEQRPSLPADNIVTPTSRSEDRRMLMLHARTHHTTVVVVTTVPCNFQQVVQNEMKIKEFQPLLRYNFRINRSIIVKICCLIKNERKQPTQNFDHQLVINKHQL